jgi:hypothetical protein
MEVDRFLLTIRLAKYSILKWKQYFPSKRHQISTRLHNLLGARGSVMVKALG